MSPPVVHFRGHDGLPACKRVGLVSTSNAFSTVTCFACRMLMRRRVRDTTAPAAPVGWSQHSTASE